MTLRDAILEARKVRGATIGRGYWPKENYLVGPWADNETPLLDYGELVSTDWLVEKPGLTFLEAMGELMRGKRVRRSSIGVVICKDDYIEIQPASFDATDWEVVGTNDLT